MKKIIYSLVIMIAAGSLFTSCVNYDEPVGVQDLREAKASYLDALSGLRAADAELQKAYAEVQKSIAAKNNADAAYRQAQVKAKEIANDKDRAVADTVIASAKAAAELAAVNHQKAMAEAQQALEKLQKKIAAEALALTEAERTALQSAINNYYAALSTVNDKAGVVAEKERALWAAKYGYEFGKNVTKDEFIAAQQDSVAKYTGVAKQWTGYKEALSKNEDFEQWQSYMSTLAAEKAADQYDSLTLEAQRIALEATTLKDNLAAAKEAWKTWEDANKPDEESVKKVTFNEDGEFTPDATVTATWFEQLIDIYVQGCHPVNSFNYEDWTITKAKAENVEKFLNGSEDGEYLKKSGLNGVIEVIKNSKLVDADSANATEVARLKKLYEDADSIYKANLDTLKKGLKLYLDSSKAVQAAIADTLKQFTANKNANDNLTAKKSERDSIYSADTAAYKAAFKASDALKEAIAEFKTGLGDNIYSTTNAKLLLEKIQEFVAAKQAAFGASYQDSIVYIKLFEGTVTPSYVYDTVAILDLKVEDLEQSIAKVEQIEETSTYQYYATNKFVKYYKEGEVVKTDGCYKIARTSSTFSSLEQVNTGDPTAIRAIPASDAQVAFGPFDKILNQYYSNWTWYIDEVTNLDKLNIITENHHGVNYTQNCQTTAFDYTNTNDYFTPEYLAAIDSVTAATDVVENIETGTKHQLTISKTNFDTAIDGAYNNFLSIYNDFFGAEEAFDLPGDTTEIANNVKNFEYYKEKLDPYAIYELADVELFPNSENVAYQLVISSLLAHGNFSNIAEVLQLVYGDDDDSQYKKMKKAYYKYEIVKNQPDIVKYFEAVQAWAKGLEAELAKVVAANTEYNDAVAEYNKKAFGFEVEDGDTTAKAAALNIASKTDETILSVDAEDLDGQELAIYNEYLAETIKQVNEIVAEKNKLGARVRAIESLYNELSNAFADIVNLLNDGTGLSDVTANTLFADACVSIYEFIDGEIAKAQNKADGFQYTIDRINAGASVRVAAEEAAEKALALAKEDLAFAEKLLAVAKAEYEAAIAKYVK